MELEFDKEIDAILRKARSGINVSTTTGDHLDADIVAAFVENSLPEKAKLFAIEHFAECNRCRKQLSSLMLMDTAEATPISSVSAPIDAPSIPWFQSIFKMPNLALASGALVLVFSGVLGYLVIQKRSASDNATVSQMAEPEQRGAPYLGDKGIASNAAPANAAAPSDITPAANTTANSATALSGRGPNAGPDTLGRADADQAKPEASRENNYQLDGASAGASLPAEPPAKAVAAPPVTTDSTSSALGSELDEKKPSDAGKLKEESKDDQLAKRKQIEDRSYRDAPRAAAKSGPSRAGPAQNQLNQMNSNMPVTRVVGGKTFNNRDGAWYDSAYQNQTTANYRRGTDEYKKLDSGLRNIADTIGGTVVVMWKSKAYRIQ